MGGQVANGVEVVGGKEVLHVVGVFQVELDEAVVVVASAMDHAVVPNIAAADPGFFEAIEF